LTKINLVHKGGDALRSEGRVTPEMREKPAAAE
jgi:hypothetical protein